MNSIEKIAYVKGLLDGVKLDQNTPEGKLIAALTECVDLLAHETEDLQKKLSALNEYVEEMDDDLSEIEEIVLDGDDDFIDDDDDDDWDDDDDDDDHYYQIVCPKCGETICFDDSLDDDTLTCPACGEHLELEFECDGDCSACERDCAVVEEEDQ